MSKSSCSIDLHREGKPSPHTCLICGLGPCRNHKQIADDIDLIKTDMEIAEMHVAEAEFHAKQQYADFVKAAMTALIIEGWDHNYVPKTACNLALEVVEEMLSRKIDFEEMTRRGK